MKTYKNPFYSPKWGSGKKEFETVSNVTEYKSFLIYKYSSEEYHIVKNDVCISMMAGMNGAKIHVDSILLGERFLNHFHKTRQLNVPLFYENKRIKAEYCKENNISESQLHMAIYHYTEYIQRKSN